MISFVMVERRISLKVSSSSSDWASDSCVPPGGEDASVSDGFSAGVAGSKA